MLTIDCIARVTFIDQYTKIMTFRKVKDIFNIRLLQYHKSILRVKRNAT